MCLKTRNPKGKVSKRPVRCYKIYNKKGGKLISPCQQVGYRIREGMEVMASENLKLEYIRNDVFIIEAGAIHAYSKFSDALKDQVGYFCSRACLYGKLSTWKPNEIQIRSLLEDIVNNQSTIICQMEIPKGERFWDGNDRDICARRMKLVKEKLPFNELDVLKAMNNYFQTWPESNAALAFKIIKKLTKEYKKKICA